MTYVSTTEHAKQIREEIKAAVKSGGLVKGLKVSVRKRSFSGGSAIDVDVTAVPAGFAVLNPERVEFETKNPHGSFWDMPESCRERYAPAMRAVLAKLNEIVDGHHVDNSTDDGGDKCWNVNFYRHVDVSGDVTNADRARLVADLAAAEKPAKPRVVVHLVEWKPKPALRLVK